MPIRRFNNRRPRLLAPSRILRPPPRQTGGGREREELVEEARKAMAKGSKSFFSASRLLDRGTRERTWLFYAWCRRCHDIVEGEEFGGPPEDAEDVDNRIQAIRILTQRALDGQPTADMAFDAFGQVAQESGLTMQMADDVIAGFELDADGAQPRTEADLMAYCYHVAGAVGVMMARVMGVPDDEEEVLDRAFDLGVAFQLTTIARDVCDDDAQGRCYLPEEWLAEADIPPGELLKPTYREKLVMLVTRLIDLAEQHEAAGRIGVAQLGFRQRWAVLSAANMYMALAQKIRDRGAHAWDHRLSISFPSRIGARLRGFMESLDAPFAVDPMPRWTRGEVLLAVRMAGPIAPIPMTPLPDDG